MNWGLAKMHDNEFSPEETARRRDEVIRHMANTPPQPHVTPKATKSKEPAEDHGLSPSRRARGASGKPSSVDH